MLKNIISFAFLLTILISDSFSFPEPQTEHVANVGNFLSQLLRDYIPKNTRQYTIINGQPPNLSSPIGRVGTAPIEVARERQQKPKQLLSKSQEQALILPSPSQSGIINLDNWSPASFNLFRPLGRSDFNSYPYPAAKSSLQHLQFQQPQQQLQANQLIQDAQIITADQVKNSAEPETVEFQIQSQMGF